MGNPKYINLAHYQAHPWARYLLVISYPLLEQLAMLLLHDGIDYRLAAMWNNSYALLTFRRQLPAALVPVPFLFLFWLRQLERDGAMPLRFSPVMAAVSLASFVGMTQLLHKPFLMMMVYTLAVAAGLFVFLPWREWLRRAAAQPRLALVGLMGMFASWNYYWLMQHEVTRLMLAASVSTVSRLLEWSGMESLAVPNMDRSWAYDLYSSRYKVLVSPYCCGFEGMFLFFFMLSLTLLLDWDRFKGRRLLPYYLLGAVVLFFVNALRVAAIFALGHWSYAEDAPAIIHAYRDSGIDLFHSYMGWVLDLLVFWLFAAWFYRPDKPKG